jgi:cation diffusion facilitator family transporter
VDVFFVAKYSNNPYFTLKERESTPPLTTQIDTVRKVTGICLGLNAILSLIKLIGGVFSSSQALVADGVHSFSDCITDIAILIGVRYWSLPPDSEHPYGHRRIETVVTVFVGFTLVIAAVAMGYNSVTSFGKKNLSSPGFFAVIAALISIISKESLFHWTRNAGKKIKSSALLANAWHQRSDALSSIPVALSVSLTQFDASLGYLDSIAALVVCLFILHAAWGIITPGIDQLIDRGASTEEIEKIRETVLNQDQVRDAHNIRTRYSGLGLQVDLHVLVDGTMTVEKSHHIAEQVKANLQSNTPNVVDVVVHIEPCEKK